MLLPIDAMPYKDGNTSHLLQTEMCGAELKGGRVVLLTWYDLYACIVFFSLHHSCIVVGIICIPLLVFEVEGSSRSR